MTVSIIIVSYNVRPFISLCISSIARSDYQDYEIIIIDNSSTDDSVQWIRDRHGKVRLHTNQENVGFSKACNQGAEMAEGKYLLFLNPDVIISESLLSSFIHHYHSHDQLGAIGAAMYDGQLRYLPESKRRMPTWANALGRMTRLDTVFQNTSLDYYDRREEPTQVEALSGANIFMSHEVFQDLGGFDEDFFMYGEDLDVSRRLRNQGKEIHYLHSPGLIHFKGGSTEKKQYAFYHHFYRSLGIYAQKHMGVGRGIFLISTLLAKVHHMMSSWSSGTDDREYPSSAILWTKKIDVIDLPAVPARITEVISQLDSGVDAVCLIIDLDTISVGQILRQRELLKEVDYLRFWSAKHCVVY